MPGAKQSRDLDQMLSAPSLIQIVFHSADDVLQTFTFIEIIDSGNSPVMESKYLGL